MTQTAIATPIDFQEERGKRTGTLRPWNMDTHVDNVLRITNRNIEGFYVSFGKLFKEASKGILTRTIKLEAIMVECRISEPTAIKYLHILEYEGFIVINRTAKPYTYTVVRPEEWQETPRKTPKEYHNTFKGDTKQDNGIKLNSVMVSSKTALRGEAKQLCDTSTIYQNIPEYTPELLPEDIGADPEKLTEKQADSKDVSAASASAQGDELLPRGIASIKEAMVWLFANKDIAPHQAIKMLARVNPATHKPYFRRDWLVMEAMRQKFTPDVVVDREKDAGGACVRINKQLIPLASTDVSEAVAIIVDTIYRTNETPSGSIVSYLYTTMKNRKEGKGYGVAAIEAQEEKRKKQIRAADKNCRYCQGYGRRSMYHSDGTPNGYLTDCECTGAINDNG